MSREVDVLELGYRVVNVLTAQRSMRLASWLKWNYYRICKDFY